MKLQADIVTGRSSDFANEEEPIILRAPRADDGSAVNELIERCKPLDENSVYCNLLQCDPCQYASLRSNRRRASTRPHRPCFRSCKGLKRGLK